MIHEKLDNLTAQFRRLVRSQKSEPYSNNPPVPHLQLQNLPTEIILNLCRFLPIPDKAILAVTCSKLYLAIRDDLSKIGRREEAECSSRLREAGFFSRHQLPCFTCAQMHPKSHFYSPELHQPLPQCIATARMWRCGCSFVTADEIRSRIKYKPPSWSCRTPKFQSIEKLFEPCEKCHQSGGLVSAESSTYYPEFEPQVYHRIIFTVPDVGLDIAALQRTIAARCASFDLPLCRHISLSDSRVLDTFDENCYGLRNACPPACPTRDRFQHERHPLRICNTRFCGLRARITQTFLGANAPAPPNTPTTTNTTTTAATGTPAVIVSAAAATNNSGDYGVGWRVVISIARPLPQFRYELHRDRSWRNAAFTDRELVDRFPGVEATAAAATTSKGVGEGVEGARVPDSSSSSSSPSALAMRRMVRMMLWSYLTREGTWEWEIKMIKHFWKARKEMKKSSRSSGGREVVQQEIGEMSA